MHAIDEAVSARLRARRDQEAALALWRQVWAAFEASGPEGAGALLESLVERPEDGRAEGGR